ERRAELLLCHLLRAHLRLVLREAAASVLSRPRGSGPAALRHHRQPAPHVLRIPALATAPADLVRRARRCAHRGGRVLVEPAVGVFTEGGEIGHGTNASTTRRAAARHVAAAQLAQSGMIWRPRKTCTPDSSSATAPIHGCTARARGSSSIQREIRAAVP